MIWAVKKPVSSDLLERECLFLSSQLCLCQPVSTVRLTYGQGFLCLEDWHGIAQLYYLFRAKHASNFVTSFKYTWSGVLV